MIFIFFSWILNCYRKICFFFASVRGHVHAGLQMRWSDSIRTSHWPQILQFIENGFQFFILGIHFFSLCFSAVTFSSASYEFICVDYSGNTREKYWIKFLHSLVTIRMIFCLCVCVSLAGWCRRIIHNRIGSWNIWFVPFCRDRRRCTEKIIPKNFGSTKLIN